MENTRALFLIEKGDLSEKDKEFLKKHLEAYEDLVHSLEGEILRLKDIIDYSKSLDNEILSIKERLVKIDTSGSLKDALASFDKIMSRIGLNKENK